MIIFLPTFVQKKTLAIPSVLFTRNSKRPLPMGLVRGKPRFEPNSSNKSVSPKYLANRPSGKFKISFSSFKL